MQDINLGALTLAVQKSSTVENVESVERAETADETTKVETVAEPDKMEFGATRIQLTDENKSRIDLLRFSSDIKFASRTQVVNAIIARYFETQSEQVSSSIKQLMEKL